MIQTILAISVLLLFAPTLLNGQSDSVNDWRLSAEPVLEISEVWGDVVGVLRLASGNIVVGDYMADELSLYSSEGRHITTSGGTGGGPGEFRMLLNTMACGGNAIFVSDPRLSRISVFDSTLTYVRSFRHSDIRGEHTTARPRRLSLLECNDQGVFASTWQNRDQYPRTQGPFPIDVQVEIAREDGEVIALDTVMTDEMIFVDSGITSRPFGSETLTAVGDDRLYVGTTDRLSIAVFSLAGEPLGTISDDVERKRTEEIMDAFLATRDEEDRAWWSGLDHPEYLPVFSDLLVDASGNLWVEEYQDPTEHFSAWRVYGPQGQLKSRLMVPERFQVYQVGSDFVLGVWRDALNVEHVRMYGLIKEPE